MKPMELTRLVDLHRRRLQAREGELNRARGAHDQLLSQRRQLGDDVAAKQAEQRDIDQRLSDQTSLLALRSGMALRSKLRKELQALEESQQDLGDQILESNDILSACVRRLRVGQQREALFGQKLRRLRREAIDREDAESEALHIEHQFASSGGMKKP
ncbi:MAG: hypothetical protein ACXIUM_12140 [Wenzhouxiangella sp.]